MKARRGRIPVRWQARQIVVPSERRIRYTHLRGPTRGMEVEWRFCPGGDGSAPVTITPISPFRWPLLGRPVADWIIGPLFVSAIAGRTLGRIKVLVERGGE